MSRILLVEDDPTIRWTVSLLLTDEGHTVLEAPNGPTALAILRTTGTPLLVLLDHVMPGMTGIDVLEIVAADPLHHQHAFALLTATPTWSLPPSFRHLRPLLALRYLAKPFTLDQILLLVSALEAEVATRYARGTPPPR